MRARSYRARRWPLVLGPLLLAVAITAVLVVVWPTSQPAYSVLPDPPLAPVGSGAATTPGAPSASGSADSALTSTTSPSSASTSTPSSTGTAVAPSQAVQIYIPNPDPGLALSTTVHPLGGCRSVIDPPRSGPDFAGVFGCTDFAQPGTDSPSLAVLAGHSSRKFDTAFNKLYVQGAALVGQTVYLRTAASGDRWLAYRIERTFTPDKDQLPYLTAVWGGDGSSTSGRLVLVTCQQNETSTTSTANYVAVAQFEGVV